LGDAAPNCPVLYRAPCWLMAGEDMRVDGIALATIIIVTSLLFLVLH
jgi:hypothetical protein